MAAPVVQITPSQTVPAAVGGKAGEERKRAGPKQTSPPISSVSPTYAHEVVTRNEDKVEILRWCLDTAAPRAPQVGQNAGGVHLAVGLDLLQGDVAGDKHARSAYAGGAVHERRHLALRLLLRLTLGLLYRLDEYIVVEGRMGMKCNNFLETADDATEGMPPRTMKGHTCTKEMTLSVVSGTPWSGQLSYQKCRITRVSVLCGGGGYTNIRT